MAPKLDMPQRWHFSLRSLFVVMTMLPIVVFAWRAVIVVLGFMAIAVVAMIIVIPLVALGALLGWLLVRGILAVGGRSQTGFQFRR